MHPTISKRKPYSPYFNPNQFSPALWLDGADSSTLISDGAASFTAASSQYLEVADNSTLRLGNTLFIACWIYPTTFNASPTYFIAKDGNTLGTREFGISFDVNGIVLFSLGGSSSGGGIPNLTLNAWNFVACWYDSQDNKHYRNVNGTVSTGTTITPYSAFGTLASFRLGSRIVSDPYFDGRLDSVVYLKPPVGWLVSNATALCSYLYNSGAGRRSSDFINSSLYSGSGAVSWWDLDEASGTRKDRIGTNDLTDNNSVGYASGIASGYVQYDGDPITSWQDKSGNSRHATAPANNRRPTYKTVQKNNLSGISFDGVDDALVTPSFAHFPNKRGTIVTVSKRPASQGAIVATYNTGIRPGYVLYSMQTGNLTKYYDDSGNRTMSGADATDTIHSVVRSVDESIDIYRNGTLGTLSAFSDNQPANNTLTIGASSALANFFGSNIYEIIIYHRALTTSQRLKIERYLANKWGITLS